MRQQNVDRMSTPYYQSITVRKAIDEVLQKNASMFANLGNTSTKKEKELAKLKERESLLNVRHLDPQTIDSLVLNGD
jgi:ABC-type transporter lipoprotein component MlaA|tara:strand:+ start:6861 stop:7091 length:231 start_codon:yes stop_codon:yes gene_type:complete